MGEKSRFYVDLMATHNEVTGSCLLNIVKFPNGETLRFIVDCGLFQGREFGNVTQKFYFNENTVKKDFDSLKEVIFSESDEIEVGVDELKEGLTKLNNVFESEITKMSENSSFNSGVVRNALKEFNTSVAAHSVGSKKIRTVDTNLIETELKKLNANAEKELKRLDEVFEKESSRLNETFPFDCNKINFALITHNHIDHIGRLPLLVKKGFNGDIYTTTTTSKIIAPALYDSYKVLKTKAKMLNTYPIYTEDDVENTRSLITPYDYEQEFYPHPNVKVIFLTNGHLFGAASILVQINCKGKEDDSTKEYDTINLLFTGDYNSHNMFFDVKPIPDWIKKLPLTIIQESTYGKMDTKDIKPVFEENVIKALADGKDILVPVFSLGRSQEIMFVLKKMQDAGKISKDIKIYFDGKLGRTYTEICTTDGLDIKEDCKDFTPENFEFVTKDNRVDLIDDGEQKIILTTSGMGSYGPAQFYIPKLIKRKNVLIHFSGYTAEGTLGRRLKDCSDDAIVEVAGLKVVKKAQVEYTNEFSAHAKADEMIEFLKQFENLDFVLVNHGESSAKEVFADRIVREVDPKDSCGILSRDYFFRLNPYGLVKPLSTKFD